MADGLDQFRRPLEPEGVLINGEKISALVTGGITAASFELTMEGCSTLNFSVSDPGYWLTRQSGLLGEKAFRTTVEVAGTRWTLEQLTKSDSGFDLVCVPTGAARMKRRRGPWKTARDRMTRADAASALAILSGTAYAKYPGISSRQPIESFNDDETGQRRDSRASAQAQAITRSRIARGALNGKGLRVNGAKADREQLRNAEMMLAVADAEGAPVKATIALIEAGIVEGGDNGETGRSDGLRNPAGGDGSSSGILQLTDAHLNGSTSTKGGRRDIALVSRLFLTEGFTGIGGAIQLARKFPEKSAGEIAQLVQGSAFPERYDQRAAEATAIVRAWSPNDDEISDADIAPLTGTPDRVQIAKYEFRVDAHQSFWEAAYKWAAEVNYRFWLDIHPGNPEGRMWFISDPLLLRAIPKLVIREGEGGIDRLRWTRTPRGKIDSVDVDCRLGQWVGLPGQVVVIEGEGDPVDGRWLIRSISRDWLDTIGTATVKLGKAQDPKPEPKPGLISRPGMEPAVDADAPLGKQTQIAKAYAKAVAIHRHQYPYSYGGNGFDPPYDCSSFVSAVLNAGDLGVDTRLDTVALGQWGKPGRGKYLTVWVKVDANGNALAGTFGHTWMQFEARGTPSGEVEIFESGGTRGAPTGRRSSHGTDGYEPRHYPGL